MPILERPPQAVLNNKPGGMPAGRDCHDTDAVPARQRRGFGTMGLLWITMVTAFPTVLAGFQWHAEGITFMQSIGCASISCLILLGYSVPACTLGALTGQTYGLLSRNCFGAWGSRAITFNLLVVFSAWYGLISLMAANALHGLLPVAIPVEILAAAIALAMSFNNLFGFAGVADFARFVAAPALIGWVFFTFAKAVPALDQHVIAAAPTHDFNFALVTVSSFVIGYAVWGNEPDYWRYSRPQAWKCALSLAAALFIGQIVFPATGWMIAHISRISDFGAATDFMTRYSFGGNSILAAAILTVSYFAVNDSNLYGATNALANLHKMPHRLAVTILSVAGAVTAVTLSVTGAARSLEAVASLNCVLLPTPTVIMAAEWFILDCLLGKGYSIDKVFDFSAVPSIRWPALLAMAAGSIVGIGTAGIIPCMETFHFGICSLQAWLTALAVYVTLRLLSHRQSPVLQEIPATEEQAPPTTL